MVAAFPADGQTHHNGSRALLRSSRRFIVSLPPCPANISGNMGKPILDLVIFTSQLSASLGPLGTIGLFANYGFTAWILRKATPAFGRMAATEARLEGDYRAGLGRIGRDGEEVA